MQSYIGETLERCVSPEGVHTFVQIMIAEQRALESPRRSSEIDFRFHLSEALTVKVTQRLCTTQFGEQQVRSRGEC